MPGPWSVVCPRHRSAWTSAPRTTLCPTPRWWRLTSSSPCTRLSHRRTTVLSDTCWIFPPASKAFYHGRIRILLRLINWLIRRFILIWKQTGSCKTSKKFWGMGGRGQNKSFQSFKVFQSSIYWILKEEGVRRVHILTWTSLGCWKKIFLMHVCRKISMKRMDKSIKGENNKL